jgi:hypothetical protein
MNYDSRSFKERLERRLWRSTKVITGRNPAVGRRHVFVAGVQRSGTNMLMELLEWSRWTDVYHETDPRAFSNYRLRPREIIRALASSSRAPIFVIKTLCELDELQVLMHDFQPAKTLWIVRHFDDSVTSAVRSFANFASQVHRLAKDKTAAEWRGNGMSDHTQRLLQTLDHSELSESSGAALMWYYRNVLFFELGLQRDARVRLLFYEDLASKPVDTMREIFNFLDLPDWSPHITRYVHAKSIGNSQLAPIEPGVRSLCDSLYTQFEKLHQKNQ